MQYKIAVFVFLSLLMAPICLGQEPANFTQSTPLPTSSKQEAAKESVPVAPKVITPDVNEELETIRQQIVEGSRYRGGYPTTNNDPNQVRRRFLGVDEANDQPGQTNYSAVLTNALERALILGRQHLDPQQQDTLAKYINQTTELLLQGWMISGNISLLEGLRITYPNSAGSQARPRNRAVPFACPEKDFTYVQLKDSCNAQLYYAEAIRSLMDVLSRHRGDTLGRVIKDIDVDPIPAPDNTLPGTFSNENFPQYTYYIEEGITRRIVPILTEGYLMGNILQKQAQSTQTIAYRLWSAAYFNSASQRNPSARQRLLDESVRNLHLGANHQFMSSLMLAATVGDVANVGPSSPYEIDKLNTARANVGEARALIERIRNQEKPTLPIDDVMAGDAQVNSIITALKGTGTGSIQQALTSYTNASSALFKVQNNALLAFQEAQTRQTQFLNRLAELTGLDPAPFDLNIPAGQTAFRKAVSDKINNALNNAEPISGATFSNRLDSAVNQVRFHRQEVLNKKNMFDSFPQRIKIVEDTLGANISAIDESQAKITAAQLAIGKANSITITTSASVSYSFGSGPTFTAGVAVQYNPGAIRVAELQNEITYATNLKEIKFLQNEAASRCRNLLLDQDLAYGELKSQLVLLSNVEDEVRKILGDTDRVLTQLTAYNSAASELYYNDPTFNTELTAEEDRANQDLDAVVANLYKLGKMLEARWLEPFSNPVSIPNGQPQSLGVGFDNFWSLESVFALGSVNVRDSDSGVNNSPPNQAQSFLNALRAWDQRLRQSGIRDFNGDLGPVTISLREDIFGFPDVKTGPTGTPITLDPTNAADRAMRDSNVRKFQNVLLGNGRYFKDISGNPVGDKLKGFLISFPLSYYSVGFSNGRRGLVRLFGNISAWNYRVASFKVKVKPVGGKRVFQNRTFAELIFAQAGTVSNIDFFESRSGLPFDKRRLREINLDNYVHYNRESLNSSGTGSPYLLFSIMKQTNFPSDPEIPNAATMQTLYWSPYTSRWILEMVADDDTELENIEDIIIELKLKNGKPNDVQWD